MGNFYKNLPTPLKNFPKKKAGHPSHLDTAAADVV